MPTRDALTAADVMTPSPRTCAPFSTVLEAVMIFRDADCGAVPVVDNGTPVGVLTDRDVALAVSEYPDLATRPVSTLMSTDVISVNPQEPIGDVLGKFGDHGVRRLLVSDASNNLVGIIAWADIAAYATDRKVGQVVSDVVEQA